MGLRGARVVRSYAAAHGIGSGIVERCRQASRWRRSGVGDVGAQRHHVRVHDRLRPHPRAHGLRRPRRVDEPAAGRQRRRPRAPGDRCATALVRRARPGRRRATSRAADSGELHRARRRPAGAHPGHQRDAPARRPADGRAPGRVRGALDPRRWADRHPPGGAPVGRPVGGPDLHRGAAWLSAWRSWPGGRSPGGGWSPLRSPWSSRSQSVCTHCATDTSVPACSAQGSDPWRWRWSTTPRRSWRSSRSATST